MQTQVKIQILSVAITLGMFVLVFELVRRKRLQERYALLWMFAAALLFALAVWSDVLAGLSTLVGIAYPPTALFGVAFAFVLVMLLHFSLVISRLSDQNKVLAQHVGRLEQRLDALEHPQARPHPSGEPEPTPEPARR